MRKQERAQERFSLSLFFFNIYIFLGLCRVLGVAHRIFQLWHVDSSSLIRDGTQAPCFRSAESKTLDHQIVFIHIFSILLYVFLSLVE